MRDICERILIPAKSIVDFQTAGDPNSKNLILVLHGYGQNSSTIINDLVNHLSQDNFYIIPNGVFPMPKQRGTNVSFRFAWYFYNSIEEKYYIDFDYPSEVLNNFLLEVNKDSRPVTILGYSQGGYLAPFVGQSYKYTSKVIGINCNFRHDMLKKEINFDLYGVHGSNDEIVEFEKSKKSFSYIRPKIKNGGFITINQANHAINSDIIKCVSGLIKGPS